MMVPLRHVVYYVNPQERKPQAQRDWLDLLQGRAHNVHEVDVCALSLLTCPLRRRYVLIYPTVSGKILQLISDFLKWLHLIKTSGVSIPVSHFLAYFYLLSGS